MTTHDGIHPVDWALETAAPESLIQNAPRFHQFSTHAGLTVVGGTKGRKASTRQTQVTDANAREGAGPEVLIFEDTFEELDLDIWEHDITMAGGGNWWVVWLGGCGCR